MHAARIYTRKNEGWINFACARGIYALIYNEESRWLNFYYDVPAHTDGSFHVGIRKGIFITDFLFREIGRPWGGGGGGGRAHYYCPSRKIIFHSSETN